MIPLSSKRKRVAALLAGLVMAACGGNVRNSNSGTGGSGGADGGSTGGSGGSPAGDAGGCGAGTKPCGGACVSEDDPSYGCSTSSCAPCALPNATATCKKPPGGVGKLFCALQTCTPGFADCNKDPADGCEVDVASDPDNCGACGSSCDPTGTSCFYCMQGFCSVPGCPVNTADCNCDPADACEVDLQIDPTNCGFCGHACAPGQSCVNGLCN